MERKEMNREVWIDYLRVTACFFVMMTHCCEPFYLGGEGSLILTQSDGVWVSILNSFTRACVPLFVVASSYLQFPLHYTGGVFARRRATRILIPFAFWSIVYAMVWGNPIDNFKDLLLNFNYAAGHLWFVYMLIGLYVLMPILSPWADKVKKQELLIYIAIWLFTTTIPLIRQWIGGIAPVIYGPTGIPNFAKYPLWGEASWNTYGAFYYLSGFIGYLFLGLYFRKFVGQLSWKKTLCIAIPAWVSGFAICAVGFYSNISHAANGTFPVEGAVGLAALWETPWLNDTTGVALMTIGWILLFKKIEYNGKFYKKILLPISNASYGMYLCHTLVLGSVATWLRTSLGRGEEGILGIFTTPVEVILSAVISFIIVALLSIFIQRIPKIGCWVIG